MPNGGPSMGSVDYGSIREMREVGELQEEVKKLKAENVQLRTKEITARICGALEAIGYETDEQARQVILKVLADALVR